MGFFDIASVCVRRKSSDRPPMDQVCLSVCLSVCMSHILKVAEVLYDSYTTVGGGDLVGKKAQLTATIV